MPGSRGCEAVGVLSSWVDASEIAEGGAMIGDGGLFGRSCLEVADR